MTSVAHTMTMILSFVHVEPQRTRLVVGKREQVDAPAQQYERDEADHDERQAYREVRGSVPAKLPSSQKVIAGSWL